MSNNGYTAAAILFNTSIRDMRNYIEYQKFLARMVIDNDITREFKQNTELLNDPIHRFIYNNPEVDKLTAF